jgi:hypothetical protein
MVILRKCIGKQPRTMLGKSSGFFLIFERPFKPEIAPTLPG